MTEHDKEVLSLLHEAADDRVKLWDISNALWTIRLTLWIIMLQLATIVGLAFARTP